MINFNSVCCALILMMAVVGTRIEEGSVGPGVQDKNWLTNPHFDKAPADDIQDHDEDSDGEEREEEEEEEDSDGEESEDEEGELLQTLESKVLGTCTDKTNLCSKKYLKDQYRCTSKPRRRCCNSNNLELFEHMKANCPELCCKNGQSGDSCTCPSDSGLLQTSGTNVDGSKVLGTCTDKTNLCSKKYLKDQYQCTSKPRRRCCNSSNPELFEHMKANCPELCCKNSQSVDSCTCP